MSNYIPDLTERYPDGFDSPGYDVEAEDRWQEYCNTNKAKLDAAGDSAIYFADDCIGCPNYESVGTTHYSSDPYDWVDDVEHGICHDLNCKSCNYRRNHE